MALARAPPTSAIWTRSVRRAFVRPRRGGRIVVAPAAIKGDGCSRAPFVNPTRSRCPLFLDFSRCAGETGPYRASLWPWPWRARPAGSASLDARALVRSGARRSPPVLFVACCFCERARSSGSCSSRRARPGAGRRRSVAVAPVPSRAFALLDSLIYATRPSPREPPLCGLERADASRFEEAEQWGGCPRDPADGRMRLASSARARHTPVAPHAERHSVARSDAQRARASPVACWPRSRAIGGCACFVSAVS